MWKNLSNAILFIEYVMLDILITVLIDIPLFFFILLGVGEVFTSLKGVETVPGSLSHLVILILAVIELFIIVVIECIRRNTYVSIDYNGVYVYNNNSVKFGMKQFYKRSATIPFSKITCCYVSVPNNVPRNYRYQYFSAFRNIGRSINSYLGNTNNPYYIPAVSRGRYDKECVLLELINGKTVVLPIDECDEFVERFNKYFR